MFPKRQNSPECNIFASFGNVTSRLSAAGPSATIPYLLPDPPLLSSTHSRTREPPTGYGRKKIRPGAVTAAGRGVVLLHYRRKVGESDIDSAAKLAQKKFQSNPHFLKKVDNSTKSAISGLKKGISGLK